MSDTRKTKSASDIAISVPETLYSFTQTTPNRTQKSSSPKVTVATYNLAEIKKSLVLSLLLILANGIVFVLVRNNIISLGIFGL